MIFGIGDIIAFSHNSEPKQGVRDVKAMRQRTQSGQTSWKEKPVIVDTHDRYPQVLVLHNNWQGNIHGINLNQLSQQEINYLTAIIDPFFAAEIIKKDGRIRSELQRFPKDAKITSPHDFYLRFVKGFIHNYDSYRLYKPQKMLNIKVIKRYSDIESRMKTSQQTSQGQEKKPSGVIDTSTQSGGSDFFSRYAQSISRMRGPRFK